MGTDHGTSLGGGADTTSERQYKYTIWVRNTALTTNIPMSDYTFEVSVKASSSIGLHINEVEFVGAQVKFIRCFWDCSRPRRTPCKIFVNVTRRNEYWNRV